MEAAKFYIEEEGLRSMFAKLVASSMDNRKTNDVHPAFIEMSKQLSPVDANIIGSFRSEAPWQPIVNLGHRDSKDNSFTVLNPNVYLSVYKDTDDFRNSYYSLTNL